MESIVPKESYIECRLCGNTISSSKPICRKCGLEISPEGVEELAQIKEQIFQAISDANSLKLIASMSLTYSLISICYYLLIGPQSVWFNLALWVSYVYFIVSFIRWHQKYSKIIFDADDLDEIQKDKRAAWILIVWSMISAFGLTILLLSTRQ